MTSVRSLSRSLERPRLVRAPRIVVAVLAILLNVAGLGLAAQSAWASPATITPGTLGNDQNGNPLQLHGLGIVKSGDTFYGFGEDKTNENSSDTSFIAIPCYSSNNLSTWTYQGEALQRQSGGDLGPGQIVERPKVIYNSSTGLYVMYVHIDSASYSESKVGVATSATPCGPYNYRGSFKPQGNNSFDMSLFKDTNGAAYLLSEDNGHGAHIYGLSSDYLSVVSTVAVLGDWEGLAMAHIGGTYYLLGSHLTGWSTNDNEYTTASSLSGPWSGWNDFAPAGSNTYNSQTANIITVQGSAATTYVYAGDRWTPNNLGASPLVWLPLSINGTSVSMTWYTNWTIDASTGQWSGGGTSSSTHMLVSTASGNCLDVANQNTSPGATIDIWECNSGSNQKWNLNADGTLTGVQSGLCLDVAGQKTAAGTPVDTWTCNGQGNQQWKLNSNGSITAIQSGLCLDVENAATAPGTPVEIWNCTGGSNQQWQQS